MSFPAESKSKRDVTEVGPFTCCSFHSSGCHVIIAGVQTHASAASNLEYWWICVCFMQNKAGVLYPLQNKGNKYSFQVGPCVKAAVILGYVEDQSCTWVPWAQVYLVLFRLMKQQVPRLFVWTATAAISNWFKIEIHVPFLSIYFCSMYMKMWLSG